ncbi:MAG: LamG domain-containing protein [Myxococcota bacterium]
MLVGLGLGLAGSQACTGSLRPFDCTESSQCVLGSTNGVCQDDGLCSFPDDECPSGQRYGDHTGPVAGDCVELGGATETTGQVPSAPSTGPTPTLDSTSTASTSSTGGSSSGFGETLEPPMATSGGPDLDEGLVFRLPMDGARTLLDDVSGNDLHGTCRECPTAEPGQQGEAASFDGTTQARIPYDDRMVTEDGFTLTFWLRPDLLTEGASYQVINKGVGDSIHNSWSVQLGDLGDDGTFEVLVRIGSTDGSSGALAPDAVFVDTWTHIGARHDGEFVTVWIDGEQAAIAPPPAMEFDTHDVVLGTAANDIAGGSTDALRGTIDDLRLYDYPLSDAQMLAVMDEGAR